MVHIILLPYCCTVVHILLLPYCCTVVPIVLLPYCCTLVHIVLLPYCCTVVHIDILYNTVLCTQYVLILCVYHTVFVITASDCHNIGSASCRSFDANSDPTYLTRNV